jgi:hypothetical protein
MGSCAHDGAIETLDFPSAGTGNNKGTSEESQAAEDEQETIFRCADILMNEIVNLAEADCGYQSLC